MTLSSDEMVRVGKAALCLLDLDGTVSLADEESWSGLSTDASIDVAGDEWFMTVPLNGDSYMVDAVVRVLDEITNDISETSRFRGVAFPRCPGHAHPASYGTEGDEVVTRCPRSAAEIGRVRP